MYVILGEPKYMVIGGDRVVKPPVPPDSLQPYDSYGDIKS